MTDSDTALDPRALRDAFGVFPTGVTVVTTVGADGAPRGFTANSFTSVSLDPPLLLVCPSRRLSSFGAFEACAHFGVSVLAEGQENVSNIFAGKSADRFAAVEWRADAQGTPLIAGAAAQFSCATVQAAPAGDHIVLIGRVLDFARSGARGLGYASGAYFSLGLERAAAETRAGGKTIAGAIVERNGAVLLLETPDGVAPPQVELSGGMGARARLQACFAAAGLDVVLGKAYSIFEDRTEGAQMIFFRARAESDATGGLGVYASIAEAAAARHRSEAVGAMLKRYAVEFETHDYNLYVGDERVGDLHQS